jgi:hypothetical protein
LAGLPLIVASCLIADWSAGSEESVPICPVDGQPMARKLRSFIGVSGKELHYGNPHQPDVAAVSLLLQDAGVHYVATKIHWKLLEPSPGQYNWYFYDYIFEAFADAGLAPMVAIRSTPAWASTNPTSQHYDLYPPADINDWTSIVGVIVDRYGLEVKDWSMWNEPNQPEFFLGTDQEYLALVNAGYRRVKELDPHARVWAPGGANHPWNSSHSLNEFLLQYGHFDVLSVNAFFYDLASMMDTVQQTQALLNQYGRPWVPISVTEVNFIETIVDCDEFSSWPQEQHAENLRSIYACLANAGADSVFWFKSTDTGGWCPSGSINRNGLVDENLVPKLPYWAVFDLAHRLPEPIYLDGFETGDTTAWSLTDPPFTNGFHDGFDMGDTSGWSATAP